MHAPLASNHPYTHYITNPPRNVCNKSALQTKKHFSILQFPPFTAVACKCHRGESNTPPRWRHSVTAVTGTFARLVRRKIVVTKNTKHSLRHTKTNGCTDRYTRYCFFIYYFSLVKNLYRGEHPGSVLIVWDQETCGCSYRNAASCRAAKIHKIAHPLCRH